MKPKVSVIIPAYNSENTISQAITSAITQGDLIGEIIVVVNGCTDNTETVVRSIKDDRIKLVESQKGKVPARNLGIRLAQFPFLALLDADDIWHEKKIEKQLELMEKEKIDVLGTQIHVVNPDLSDYPDQIEYPTSNEKIIAWMLNGSNALANSSVVIKSSVLEHSGNYEDCFPFCEDYHLWLRCIKFAKISNIDEKLVTYRFEHKQEYDPRIARALSTFYRNLYIHTGVVSCNF